eukprot:scaffold63471_cov44-Tisochrysis_lutea.AAC.1
MARLCRMPQLQGTGSGAGLQDVIRKPHTIFMPLCSLLSQIRRSIARRGDLGMDTWAWGCGGLGLGLILVDESTLILGRRADGGDQDCGLHYVHNHYCIRSLPSLSSPSLAIRAARAKL